MITQHGSNNVFIGYQAGYAETNSNKLYIENSNSTTPLIYGEFDNNLLQINGTLNMNGSYDFPTIDGAGGQILATDGSGSIHWSDIATITTFSDANGDTKIQVEESSDDDIIRFDIGGVEYLKLDSGQIGDNQYGSIHISSAIMQVLMMITPIIAMSLLGT